ncbi:fibronectin type III-like domain-contianing protein [Mesorhizobium sp. B2-3-4]|uniref:fibronectin type III-like domain-contianing protein n=1 Tax=Mesorhizobium sp. B2-3-4 TaxID=2589959 RepID=UPI001FEE3772|nr:fibronectin type III-like domain-contianing protein [Mesorhizobium sp. B2-3-4]
MSYTAFAYSGLTLDRAVLRACETVAVRSTVTNTGKVAGKEICQIYARYGRPRLKRPVRELKGFAKVELSPGESGEVTVEIAARDLCAHDTTLQAWTLNDDVITIEVGASSRDIRLGSELHTVCAGAVHRRIEWDTQPVFVLENPAARYKFNGFLQKQLCISFEDADRMLEHCANSFVGIFTTFDRCFRHTFPKADVAALLAEINQEADEQDRRAA